MEESLVKRVREDFPDMGPVTPQTLIFNLRASARAGHISPGYARAEIAKLQPRKRFLKGFYATISDYFRRKI